jgi:type IV pilus assembly protein PilY1
VDSGEFIEFSTGNASSLRPYLRASDDTEAVNIINFIRGAVSGYRDRTVNNEVWKLGDIVHSTPSVAGKPLENYSAVYSDESYSSFLSKYLNRDTMIYLGANDGMLHAFWAGVYHPGDNPSTSPEREFGWFDDVNSLVSSLGINHGDEAWAYIPQSLLPHLKWLTDLDYTHVYYVDLKPKAADVKIFTDDADHPNGWGTVLIGGMRFGGGDISVTDDFGSGNQTRTFRSTYFALDVTQPQSPILLWEFTHANLGYTMSYPAIAKINDKWFMIVGSGPTFTVDDPCTGESSQAAHVFIIDLETGALLKDFTTSNSSSFMASPITIDVNLNYNIDTCYIGETHEQGSSWLGEMYRISTKTGSPLDYDEDPTNWTLSTLFNSPQPITSAPSASIDQFRNIWTFFGTGRYFSDDDKIDTSSQSFYGFKDPCWNGSCTTTFDRSDLFDATSVKVYTSGEVSGVTGVTNFSGLISEVRTNYDGWYIDLPDSGERVLNKPVILGGIVLYSSFTPSADICGYGGSSKLSATYFETGSAYKESVIGTETEGEKEKVLRSIDLGAGLPSSPSVHVGKEEGGKGYIQQSTGIIEEVDVNPAFKVKSGTINWREE